MPGSNPAWAFTLRTIYLRPLTTGALRLKIPSAWEIKICHAESTAFHPSGKTGQGKKEGRTPSPASHTLNTMRTTCSKTLKKE